MGGGGGTGCRLKRPKYREIMFGKGRGGGLYPVSFMDTPSKIGGSVNPGVK